MIRPGDTLRTGKPLLVREVQRFARGRSTWALVEVEINDIEIEDGVATVERQK